MDYTLDTEHTASGIRLTSPDGTFGYITWEHNRFWFKASVDVSTLQTYKECSYIPHRSLEGAQFLALAVYAEYSNDPARKQERDARRALGMELVA